MNISRKKKKNLFLNKKNHKEYYCTRRYSRFLIHDFKIFSLPLKQSVFSPSMYEGAYFNETLLVFDKNNCKIFTNLIGKLQYYISYYYTHTHTCIVYISEFSLPIICPLSIIIIIYYHYTLGLRGFIKSFELSFYTMNRSTFCLSIVFQIQV